MSVRVRIVVCAFQALLAVAGIRDTRAAGSAPDSAPPEPAAPPAAERVYLTAESARMEIFPRAARFEVDRRAVTPEVALQLQKALGIAVTTDSIVVQKALSEEGQLLGYAVVSEEIGKYHPITFMVGTSPDLKVERVSILVYRESHGGEVRRQRFLSQYRGKSFQNPIRINQDIVNISGATLSVRALNQGVRRVLGLLEAFYGPTRH